jgi:hypothetical protein
MYNYVIIKRLSFGSLFKVIVVGWSISLISFATLMGAFAFFGGNTIRWNDKNITGFTGLIVSPFIGLFLTAIFTILCWFSFAFSFWVFSQFGHLRIKYVAVEKKASEQRVPVDR